MNEIDDEMRDRAALYVLGQLTDEERLAFESSMDSDPELAAYARGLDEAVARKIRSLPQHEPSKGLLGTIESRISGSKVTPFRPATHGPARGFWWVAAAAAFMLAVGAAFYAGRKTGRLQAPLAVLVHLEPNHGSATTVSLHDDASDENGRFVELAGMAQVLWQKPHEDYALYDPTTRQGFVGIRSLPPGPARARYALWLLDGATGRIRFAGEIPADASKGGLYAFSLDAGVAVNAADVQFFVTADGPDGALNPETGRVILGQRHS